MFGKTVAQYLSFQKVILAVIVLAWLVRLTLSLTGVPPILPPFPRGARAFRHTRAGRGCAAVEHPLCLRRRLGALCGVL